MIKPKGLSAHLKQVNLGIKHSVYHYHLENVPLEEYLRNEQLQNPKTTNNLSRESFDLKV